MDQLVSSNGEGTDDRIRVRIHVNGIVQGVGFRPHVFRLAQQNGLTGFVCNRLGEVILEVEGHSRQMEVFKNQLQFYTIKPIRIDSLEVVFIPVINDKQFAILPSEGDGQATGVFPPDLAVCTDCLDDLHNVHSRFHQYPFTSCTSCGPRFSTIRSLPYDRNHTSFENFQTCKFCEAEYHHPSNRRFHAQTIACSYCGPLVEVRDASGEKLPKNGLTSYHTALRDGDILAVKGIGGIHLVCDAKLKHAIEKLRVRKRRSNKPFALMVKDCAVAENYFEISNAEMEALRSPAAPIVLLKPKPEASKEIPLEVIAPGLTRIGIMLPYTPLHHMLFAGGIEWIVATSGNQSGYPMTYDNNEALCHLQGVADQFVLHTREIVMWIDDSVGQIMDGEFQLIRRSRGYVPEALPIPLPRQVEAGKMVCPTVLGIGAEMKNTFCFLHHGKAFLSQHMGDIRTLESLQSQHTAQNHFKQLLHMTPHLIVYDPHPDYLISREVKESSCAEVIPVYHHHAHMAACMAENMIDTPVIGCILDGTGYGQDGTLWGFEILIGDYIDFERVHHLQPILLPGGDAAIRYPWMTGLSLLHGAAADRKTLETWAAERFPQYQLNFPIVLAQLGGKLPSPSVSSAGRLFDGVSAILNICTENTYEGEAAARLSEMIESSMNPADVVTMTEKYPYEMTGDHWNVAAMIRGIMYDLQNNISVTAITQKFHYTLADMMLEGVRKARRKSGITSVVFSGGVWNNRYLHSVAKGLLMKDGFSVYTHKKVPAGDGGIALGQAVCGLWRWAKEHVLIGADESRGGICK